VADLVSDTRALCGAVASLDPQASQLNAACAIPDSANEHTMKITTPRPATTSFAHAIFFSFLVWSEESSHNVLVSSSTKKEQRRQRRYFLPISFQAF
jgi:hypothetical protein